MRKHQQTSRPATYALAFDIQDKRWPSWGERLPMHSCAMDVLVRLDTCDGGSWSKILHPSKSEGHARRRKINTLMCAGRPEEHAGGNPPNGTSEARQRHRCALCALYLGSK